MMSLEFYAIGFAALWRIFGRGEHWWEVTSIPDVTILWDSNCYIAFIMKNSGFWVSFLNFLVGDLKLLYAIPRLYVLEIPLCGYARMVKSEFMCPFGMLL